MDAVAGPGDDGKGAAKVAAIDHGSGLQPRPKRGDDDRRIDEPGVIGQDQDFLLEVAQLLPAVYANAIAQGQQTFRCQPQ